MILALGKENEMPALAWWVVEVVVAVVEAVAGVEPETLENHRKAAEVVAVVERLPARKAS